MRLFVIALVMSVQVAGTGLQGQAPADTAPADISIEAGLLLRNGDVKRVARTPLTVLDADFAPMLLQVFDEGVRNVSLQANFYIAVKRVFETGGRASQKDIAKVTKMDEFIKAHTVATTITDFDGKATVQVPPGNYFVHGVFEIAPNVAIWSVPIQAKPGRNDIVLDQNNTAK